MIKLLIFMSILIFSASIYSFMDEGMIKRFIIGGIIGAGWASTLWGNK